MNAPEGVSPEAAEVPDKSAGNFSGAGTFESLYDSIDAAVGTEGRVVGTVQEYSADDLRQIIDGVRAGTYPIEAVTRAEGLREKVWELLGAERERLAAAAEAETARFSAARAALGLPVADEPRTPALDDLSAGRGRVDALAERLKPEPAAPATAPGQTNPADASPSTAPAQPQKLERAADPILNAIAAAGRAAGLEGTAVKLGDGAYGEAIVFAKQPAPGQEPTVRLYRGISRLDQYGAASVFSQVSGAMRTTDESGRTFVLDEMRPYVEKLAGDPSYEDLRAYADKIEPLLKSDSERMFLRTQIGDIEDALVKGERLGDLLRHAQFGFNGGSSNHWLAPYMSASMETREPSGYGQDAVVVLDVPLSEVDFTRADGNETFVKGAIDPRYITAVVAPPRGPRRDEEADPLPEALERAAAAIDAIAPTSRATREDMRKIEDARRSPEAEERARASQERDAEAVWARRANDLASRFDAEFGTKEVVARALASGAKQSEAHRAAAEHVFDALAARLAKVGRNVADLRRRERDGYSESGYDRAALDATALLGLRAQTEHFEDLYESRRARRR